MMRKSRLLLIIAALVAAVLLVPPYISWLSYEPQVVIVEDAPPELVWDYPWDRGLDISISWSTSVYEKADYPYASTRSPVTGLKTVDLQATYYNFDIYDVPDWIPTYTETVPEKPGFLDYLASYYNLPLGEVIPDDGLAYGRLSCLFTFSEGSLAGTKMWLDLTPDDPSSKDRIYPFDKAGDYSDSFSMYTRTYSGTYTFTLAVTAIGDGTIGDDSVTFVYVNRY